MQTYLTLCSPCLMGISLAAALHVFRRKLPFGRYDWPLYFFLALLGTAANNTAAVFFAGGEAFLPSGGFGGGNLTALSTGLFLVLFAAPGIVTCLVLHRKAGGSPGPAAGWIWGWILTWGGVSCAVCLLGVWPGYGGGMPLGGYLALMPGVILLLSGAAGYRWGADGPLGLGITLGGGGVFCLACVLLAAGMRAQARIDPNWGLSLTQTSAGLWYTRLNLPAAVLVGDYQYDWDITAPLLCLSALAPSALFTAGWLGGRALKFQKARSRAV